MQLLFDQNLPRHLVERLSEEFPGSAHVSELGLSQAIDNEIWLAARDRGFTIESTDSDFNNLLFLRGYPPDVVWIQRGNCSTSDIETLLRSRRREIGKLSQGRDGLLVIR